MSTRQDGPLLVGAVDQLIPGKIVPLLRNAAGELIVTSGGASGSTVDLISVGGSPIAIGQATMAASLPVVIASDQSPIPITGSISATNPSVDATGGAVPSDATYVGINIGGTLTGAVGGHGLAAGALRVELPTDGTGVIATVGAVTALTNALPAGNNNIGDVDVASVAGNVTVVQPTGTNLHTVIDSGTITTVSTVTSVTAIANALPAGNNNIGDVDIASSVLPTGASTLAEQQTQTTSLQLLDDAVATTGSAITAKGFAAAGTDGTNARILKTDTSGELQIDILSQIPGVAATNLGKAEDSGHTSADTGVFVLAVRQDSPDTAVTNTTADYSQISVSSTGAVRNAPMSEDFAALANGPQVKKYYANTGAVTDGIVWSPASGKRWYVTDLVMTISAAATITFEDDKAGGDEIVLAGDFAANSGLSSHFQTPLFSGEDAADLLVTTSAGNVKITVTGYEI